jgi:outer membrane protein assembly factor BamD
MSIKKYILVSCLMATVYLFSCSQVKLAANASEDERMNAAMKLFEKGNYLDAKTQFRILTLSHSGSLLADKAQFYLAECHFNIKEYILAASEYERLIKVYPSSEYTDDAKFKLGLSYFKLSPKYGLDQDYTRQAIVHFQEFVEDYHDSELTPEVEKYLQEARNKLSQKIFSSAEIYRKMKYYESANIYYNKVIEQYYDTPFAAKALFWIGDCTRALKKYQEALDIFDEFLQKFPNHEWTIRARNKILQIRREYEKYQRQEARKKGQPEENLGE